MNKCTNPKVILVAPNSKFSINSSHIATIYLEPIIRRYGEDSVYVAYSPDDLILAKKKYRLLPLVVGNVPSNFLGSTSLMGFVHLVVDRYILTTSPWSLRVTPINVSILLKLMYQNCMPSKVLVNNDLMKSDFQSGFSLLGITPEIFVIPHPVTQVNIDVYENLQGFKRVLQKPQSLKLLLDSGYGIVDTKFRFRGRHESMIFHLPWNAPTEIRARAIIEEGIIGLVNLRPFSSCLYDSKRVWLIDLKKRLRFFYKIMVSQVFHLFKTVNLEVGAVSYKHINNRWKPATKLSTSIAFGIPLLTEREESILQFSRKFNFPIFEYFSLGHFIDVFEYLKRSSSAISADIEANRLLLIDKINAEVESTILLAIHNNQDF